MAEPYIGQVIMVGFNFAPRGWAFCDGQLMSIAQNSALFSLLGCVYGGDCRTTFALPDLRGRVPIHQGQGPGLSEYRLGQKGGATNITLTVSQMPSHSHAPNCRTDTSNSLSPQSRIWGPDVTGTIPIFSNQAPSGPMRNNILGNAGGNQSHTNEQPFLGIYFCIALFGIYPPRG